MATTHSSKSYKFAAPPAVTPSPSRKRRQIDCLLTPATMKPKPRRRRKITGGSHATLAIAVFIVVIFPNLMGHLQSAKDQSLNSFVEFLSSFQDSSTNSKNADIQGVPLSENMGTTRDQAIIKPKCGSKLKERQKGGGVLYLARLNLSDKFLHDVNTRNQELHWLLSLTKIGESETLEGAYHKMRTLQTHYSFATIRFLFIQHNWESRFVERGVHFIMGPHRHGGEWFDLDNIRYHRILRKFQYLRANFHGGITTFPRSIASGAGSGLGFLYMAWYNWNNYQLTAIRDIAQNAASANSRLTARRMRYTKIGATANLSANTGRGNHFIWAISFSTTAYDAYQIASMQDAENEVHYTYRNRRGVGEWFYLTTHNTTSIEQQYGPSLPGMPRVWERTAQQFYYGRLELIRWISIGLVDWYDLYYVIFTGHFNIV